MDFSTIHKEPCLADCAGDSGGFSPPLFATQSTEATTETNGQFVKRSKHVLKEIQCFFFPFSGKQGVVV